MSSRYFLSILGAHQMWSKICLLSYLCPYEGARECPPKILYFHLNALWSSQEWTIIKSKVNFKVYKSIFHNFLSRNILKAEHRSSNMFFLYIKSIKFVCYILFLGHIVGNLKILYHTPISL